MEVIRCVSLAADGPLFFFPFGCQAKTPVMSRKRREMPPENVLLFVMSVEINRAGAHWQGSGRLNPMIQGQSDSSPVLGVLLTLPRAPPLPQ